MSDYDFSELNDKEFEIFCADLIGDELGYRIERFKPGRDSGVDGRYFSSNGGEVVLQCKHWPATPIEKLIAKLEEVEAPKVLRLKPARYLLAISKPLSRRDKRELKTIFAPFVLKDNDIYGREDLNDLLSTRPEVLKRHTKLWMQSADVLSLFLNHAIHGRSDFALDEMIAAARTYVRTESHQAALKLTEETGVVIIAGEPGIGKTTLAEQLCLEYVASEFSLFKIADDIAEAEAVFRADAKQLFYFDDFLGRNYLDAFRGTSGSHIVQFIKRVTKSKKNKRFILTSRSTILNRGKLVLDSYRHEGIDKNEHVISISSLTEMDRARILYNHIWFSTLPQDYVEEIYTDKRYRDIIDHDNYNPRLIQFITDHERLKECSPAKYWATIKQSLDNPSEVWENPFTYQLDPNGRALVLLVVVNGRPIRDESLGISFARFVAEPTIQHLVGGLDFVGTLKPLVGSFLSRTITDRNVCQVDLFNPSIADYVLRRYATDGHILLLATHALRSVPALTTLRSQLDEKIISNYMYSKITRDLLDHMHNEGFRGYDASFMAEIISMNLPLIGDVQRKLAVESAIKALSCDDAPRDCSTFCEVFLWAIRHDVVAPEVVITFLLTAATEGRDEAELRSMIGLLMCIDNDTPNWHRAIEEIQASAVYWMSDYVSELISEGNVLSEFSMDDTWSAGEAVENAVKEKLSEFTGLSFTSADIRVATRGFDVEQALIDLHTGDSESGGYVPHRGGIINKPDDVDDLFDRR